MLSREGVRVQFFVFLLLEIMIEMRYQSAGTSQLDIATTESIATMGFD